MSEACCSRLAGDPISVEQAQRLATVMKALSDPGRLRLLSLIQAHEEGEACVCHLVEPLGLAQPTVSRHLKVLHDAGLLARQKRGAWVYYRALPEVLSSLAGVLGAPVLV